MRWGHLFSSGFLFLFVGLFICAAHAGDAPDVYRIEEDWELVVRHPGPNASPQFDTVMNVDGDSEGSYARLTWNYRELPECVDGGLQVQSCFGKQQSGWFNEITTRLCDSEDTITWTQVLKITGRSQATFKIKDGHSAAWGSFGGSQSRIELHAENGHLNNYYRNCQIFYGLNKVAILRIKEVRKYDADGKLISKSESPIIFCESQPDPAAESAYE